MKKQLRGKNSKIGPDTDGDTISSLVSTVDIADYVTVTRVEMDASRDGAILDQLKKGDMMSLMTLAMDTADADGDVVELTVDDVGECVDNIAASVDIIQGYVKKPFVFRFSNKDLTERVLRIYRGRAGIIGEPDLMNVARRYGAKIL